MRWHGRRVRRPFLRPLCIVAVIFTLAGVRTGAVPAPHADGHVSLRARNEPVQAVLLRLARESGASITVGQGVSGYVTVSLHAVTLPQALAAILTPLGDTFRIRGGVYDVEAGTGGRSLPPA